MPPLISLIYFISAGVPPEPAVVLSFGDESEIVELQTAAAIIMVDHGFMAFSIPVSISADKCDEKGADISFGR